MRTTVKEIDRHTNNRGWSFYWSRYNGGTITAEYFSRFVGDRSMERWTKKGNLEDAQYIAKLDEPHQDFSYYKSEFQIGEFNSIKRGSEVCGWTCRDRGYKIS